MLWVVHTLLLAFEQECGVVKEAYTSTCCGRDVSTSVTIPPPAPPPPDVFDDLLESAVGRRQQLIDATLGMPTDVPWADGPETRDSGKPLAEYPNVVYILLDDAGYNDVSFSNAARRRSASSPIPGPTITTPNMDEVAASGVTFGRAYSATSTCSPSRSAIMTARNPAKVGHELTPIPSQMTSVVGLWVDTQNPEPPWLPPWKVDPAALDANPEFDFQGTPSEETFLSEVLKARGYHTAHIGKWHLGEGNGMDPLSQGFDETLGFGPQGYNGYGNDATLVRTINRKAFIDVSIQLLSQAAAVVWGETDATGNYTETDYRVDGYLTDYFTDQALTVIDKHKHEPFFLYLSHWGPHNPYHAKREDYDQFPDEPDEVKRVYKAMMLALDRSVGRIRDKLRAEGLLDDTIIVVTSDNGGAGYSGAEVESFNAPWKGFKVTHFEGGIRVPTAMSYPARIPAGTVRNDMMTHMDLTATLAKYAGTSMPAHADGVDLRSYIANGGAPPNEYLHFRQDFVNVTMTNEWKQIDYVDYAMGNNGAPVTLLYNLLADETEEHNVAGSRADVLATLSLARDDFEMERRGLLWNTFLTIPVKAWPDYLGRTEYFYTPG